MVSGVKMKAKVNFVIRPNGVRDMDSVIGTGAPASRWAVIRNHSRGNLLLELPPTTAHVSKFEHRDLTKEEMGFDRIHESGYKSTEATGKPEDGLMWTEKVAYLVSWCPGCPIGHWSEANQELTLFGEGVY
jgi:hypothetical protein